MAPELWENFFPFSSTSSVTSNLQIDSDPGYSGMHVASVLSRRASASIINFRYFLNVHLRTEKNMDT